MLSSDDYTTFFRFPWSASPAGALNVFRSTYGPSDLRHQLTRRRIPRLTRCWKVPGWLAVKFPLMSQHRRSLDEFLCWTSNLGTHPTIVHLGRRLFCFLDVPAVSRFCLIYPCYSRCSTTILVGCRGRSCCVARGKMCTPKPYLPLFLFFVIVVLCCG